MHIEERVLKPFSLNENGIDEFPQKIHMSKAPSVEMTESGLLKQKTFAGSDTIHQWSS
ncbi:MAG TPA: hypothetical protein VGN16_18445 [Acidobacteriaceae bacterium]